MPFPSLSLFSLSLRQVASCLCLLVSWKVVWASDLNVVHILFLQIYVENRANFALLRKADGAVISQAVLQELVLKIKLRGSPWVLHLHRCWRPELDAASSQTVYRAGLKSKITWLTLSTSFASMLKTRGRCCLIPDCLRSQYCRLN